MSGQTCVPPWMVKTYVHVSPDESSQGYTCKNSERLKEPERISAGTIVDALHV